MPISTGTNLWSDVSLGLAEVTGISLGRSAVFERGGVPVITSFTVTPTQINRSAFRTGDVIQLNWGLTGVVTQRMFETTAAGVRNEISIYDAARTLTHLRPNQTTACTLFARNANGEVNQSVVVEIVANAVLSYFRMRAGSFSQHPLPGGGTTGTIILEWQAGGEPFPEIALSGAGPASFDSAVAPHRDHTNHTSGIGSIRITQGLSEQIVPKTYTLRARNKVNTVSLTYTFNWPIG